MRPATPLEVFGLVPIPPPALRALPGWRVSLTPPGERTPVPLVVTAIEFGRVPIDAADAKLIFPDLPVTRALPSLERRFEAVLRVLARSQRGRPTAQVQRMLRDSLSPLGVRLSPAALHELAADIAAGRPVELP
jgi:hypothetical protein